jgi:hypothetical protein
MELLGICLTAPLSIGLSFFLALSPTKNLIRQHKIIYLIFWGLLIFCLSIIMLEIISANDIYSHSVGENSQLPKSIITSVKSNKTPIMIEFALRGFLGKSRYDDTCRTRSDICSLADKMVDDMPAELWSADTGFGVSIVGVVTALIAIFSLVVFV